MQILNFCALSFRPLGVYLCFLIVYLVLGSFHEQWRDEGQAYMLAAHSASIGEMLENLGYEGHPPLWYLILRVGAATGLSGPEVLWWVQAMLAAGTATLWLLYFPIPVGLRWLGLFSYFFLFEYGVIARSYSLGCFLWMVALVCRPLWVVRGAVFLLAFTSLYGWLLSFIFLIKEGLMDRHRWIGLIGLYAVPLGMAVWLMIPNADQQFFQPKYFSYFSNWPRWSEVTTTLTRIFSTLVPITFRWPFYWNDEVGTRVPNAIFAALFLVVLFVFFRKSRAESVTILSLGLAMVSLISLCVFASGFRHYGHWFLIMLGVIAWDSSWIKDRWRYGVIAGILVFQALGGARHMALDVMAPYSSGKEAARMVAEVLKENPDWEVVGGVDYTASTLAHYLGRAIYYLNRGEVGTFVRWDKKRFRSDEAMIEDLNRWADRGRCVVVLDADYAKRFGNVLEERFKKLKTRSPRFILDEDYVIYVVGA